ncbi:VRR-NUC domain-containing protein [Ralstonia sp. 25C]|uniref:VRR-NUC domain-containing protein n=1 Tax=Ralstonia sp. 25C TaxID=3447363 RepID=UPI003F752566
MTLGIRRDADAASQVWKYKAEVGYNMSANPPKPIMSSVLRNQPYQFPLSVMDVLPDEVVAAFEKAVLMGRAQKGMLRIPDVVIVKNMHDFDLNQPNIAYVVEIKFETDRPRGSQMEDYVTIAGSPGKVELLEQGDCPCSPCKEEDAKQSAKVKVPDFLVAPDITTLLPRLQPKPVPVADALEQGQNSFDRIGVVRTSDGGWLLVVLTVAMLALL